jgi:uncharacterized protein
MSISTNSKSKTALIDVTVQPKASRSMIVFSDAGIKVYLNSPPVDGRANSECIALLSKALGIAKSFIEIEKGDKGRKKRIRIPGISTEEVLEKLRRG